jgi:hypothetical protein
MNHTASNTISKNAPVYENFDVGYSIPDDMNPSIKKAKAENRFKRESRIDVSTP